MPVVPSSSCFSQVSTLTVQQLVDYAHLFPWTTPAMGVAGYNDVLAVAYANDIIQEIMSKSNPWKWNAQKVAPFQTQAYQQDYPTTIHQSQLGWLQSAVALDVNGTSVPRAIVPITCVQAILPTYITNRPSKMAWIPNYMAQTGSWPGPNMAYIDPLVANGGGPNSNPLTAITDPNGNIQVVTTYGITGATQPTWPADDACPGTTTNDGAVVWTVMDPSDVALRLDALATNNSIVWQLQAIYQQKPPIIANLSDNFGPVPDDLNYLIRQGFLTFCYKQSDSNKFQQEFAQWQADIQKALGSADRELTEFGFYPNSPIQGGGDTGSGTYSYPGWPGWSG